MSIILLPIITRVFSRKTLILHVELVSDGCHNRAHAWSAERLDQNREGNPTRDTRRNKSTPWLTEGVCDQPDRVTVGKYHKHLPLGVPISLLGGESTQTSPAA